MSSLLKNYVNREDFKSYEDFKENFQFKIPENFNFAYDIMDKYAEIDPEKLALLWCNDEGEERRFTFKDLKEKSNQIANFFKRIGIKKGDAVILTLKNRYEFWFSMMALHKIGAIPIPSTHMLRTKDMIYRIKNAGVKMILSIDTDSLIKTYEEAEEELKADLLKVYVNMNSLDKDIPGWYNLSKEIEDESMEFTRPTGDESTENTDPFLIYFSSGTTGQPKMVLHDFTYPLGHIITAKYWHNVVEDERGDRSLSQQVV